MSQSVRYTPVYTIEAHNPRTGKRQLVRTTDGRVIGFSNERQAIRWGQRRIGDRATGATGWNLKFRNYTQANVLIISTPSQQRSWGF